MLPTELLIVFAKREFVNDWMVLNRYDGRVETPVMLRSSDKADLERIKIYRQSSCQSTHLEDFNEVRDFTISNHVSLCKAEITQSDQPEPESVVDDSDLCCCCSASRLGRSNGESVDTVCSEDAELAMGDCLGHHADVSAESRSERSQPATHLRMPILARLTTGPQLAFTTTSLAPVMTPSARPSSLDWYDLDATLDI